MRRPAAALLALALSAALAGCTDDAAPTAAGPAPTVTFRAGDAPVLQPGAPGEEAAVVAPGEAGSMADPEAYGDVDVTFMSDMVVHHGQALAMAELAPDRAQDARVLALAERIAATQGPEVQAMSAWLSRRDLPVPAAAGDRHGGGHGGGHAGMPGMATPEQLDRLAAARGTAFDRLFLQLMTAHHEGALRMAGAAAGAQHPVVSETVDDVVAGQSVEIRRMQEVLADLPA